MKPRENILRTPGATEWFTDKTTRRRREFLDIGTRNSEAFSLEEKCSPSDRGNPSASARMSNNSPVFLVTFFKRIEIEIETFWSIEAEGPLNRIVLSDKSHVGDEISLGTFSQRVRAGQGRLKLS